MLAFQKSNIIYSKKGVTGTYPADVPNDEDPDWPKEKAGPPKDGLLPPKILGVVEVPP